MTLSVSVIFVKQCVISINGQKILDTKFTVKSNEI